MISGISYSNQSTLWDITDYFTNITIVILGKNINKDYIQYNGKMYYWEDY